MRLVVADVVANGAVSVGQPKVGGANDETQNVAPLPPYTDSETALFYIVDLFPNKKWSKILANYDA